jgi:hypothetical protein
VAPTMRTVIVMRGVGGCFVGDYGGVGQWRLCSVGVGRIVFDGGASIGGNWRKEGCEEGRE